MAAIRPKGRATASAMALVNSVPESSGRMPNFASANRGVHSVEVRNSSTDTSAKKCTASEASTYRMPAVVNTEMSPLRTSRSSTTRSRRSLLCPRTFEGSVAECRVAVAVTCMTFALLSGQEVCDRDADLGACAREQGPGLARVEVLLGERVGLGRQRDVAHLVHELHTVAQVELHEVLHFLAVGVAATHVHEDRA